MLCLGISHFYTAPVPAVEGGAWKTTSVLPFLPKLSRLMKLGLHVCMHGCSYLYTLYMFVCVCTHTHMHIRASIHAYVSSSMYLLTSSLHIFDHFPSPLDFIFFIPICSRQSPLPIWLDLESPRRHTSGPISEGISERFNSGGKVHPGCG